MDTGGDADNISKNPRKLNRYTGGWRFGATNGAVLTCIVLLINLVVTIWSSAHDGSDEKLLYEGNCEHVRRLNSMLHLLINIFSTVLLSASNYSMQCLSAPTRKEVDRAHAKGAWLDIGVPSVRNLTHISKKRVVLWAMLGLSSLPLHLFYNSVVFSSIASNGYSVFSVSQSFIDDPECFHCDKFQDLVQSHGIRTYPNFIQSLHQDARDGTLERLENAECIDEYAQTIQSNRRNLLLVAGDDKYPSPNQNPRFNNTKVFNADQSYPADFLYPYRWLCSGLEHSPSNSDECVESLLEVKKNPQTWKIGSREGYTQVTYPIDYCLSERPNSHCKLQFSLPIAVLVIVLNALKAAVIFYTVFGVEEDPLLTVGDAVSSFMEKEDMVTRDMCLLTMKDVKRSEYRFSTLPKQWTKTTPRWRDVTSKERRVAAFTLSAVALTIVSVLLGLGIQSLPGSRSLSAIAELGFGTIDPRIAIRWGYTSTISNTLLANLPQPILSFIYFTYNGLFTCMLLGYEWSLYAHQRKGLRVSAAPRGAQRSTYFLQLPYRFALPLMALSGLLHWLVSQSIFLLAIDFYDYAGSRTVGKDGLPGGFKTCGYSPIAIISVIIVAVITLLMGFGFGWIPFKPGINLAGSCSAAISAACHDTEWANGGGREASAQDLQWGVVSRTNDGIGHCCFSVREVELPRDGELYAGYSKID
ncbi:hypothetical protein BDV95DRAFT_606853 [Massariosphaeria phaeospora]|uniref:DUF6536 domain-containing protein n=1 Tax=Massariosphaeria phaeospora TaxID=100035 RepID=A0A7C8I5M3_9PLEO|nr:hypothetical protein BDV95DRAFT_606853 [Massariosphaeria phaeospora]